MTRMLPTPMLTGLGYDEMGNAPHLLSADDARALEEATWYRAGHDTVCSICGYPFWQHPPVQGCLWLHRVCDGGLVKL